MRVLIWKGYGEIDVHCIETVKQVEGIAEDVYDIVKSWNIPEAAEFRTKIDAIMETHKRVGEEKTRTELIRLVLSFVQDQCQGDDSFERFTSDRVKY